MNNIANDHAGRNVVCKQHGIILVEAIIANVCTVMIKVSVHTMGTNLRKDLYVTQAYSAFRGRWGACIGVQDCKLCVLKTTNASMYGNITTVHCYGLHLAFLKLEHCMCYLYYIVMYDNCVHTSKV